MRYTKSIDGQMRRNHHITVRLTAEEESRCLRLYRSSGNRKGTIQDAIHWIYSLGEQCTWGMEAEETS
jgi:hypothetical protein